MAPPGWCEGWGWQDLPFSVMSSGWHPRAGQGATSVSPHDVLSILCPGVALTQKFHICLPACTRDRAGTEACFGFPGAPGLVPKHSSDVYLREWMKSGFRALAHMAKQLLPLS